MAVARHAATMSVRMERCVEHENALATERVRQAEAEFVPPEGVGEVEAARLRYEAGKRALFDDSKASCLARKYEADAQRNFFKALKEFRQVERAARAAEEDSFAPPPVPFRAAEPAEGEAPSDAELGSFSQGDLHESMYRMICQQAGITPIESPSKVYKSTGSSPSKGGVDVPISITKRP